MGFFVYIEEGKSLGKINENIWRKLLTKVVGNSIILLAAKI